jgi:uncharacterized membrane protein YqjE
MILQVPRMAPHVVRHVAALARLGAQDAKQAAAVYGRYAMRVAIAGVAGFLALLMACAWILAATWDTDYRAWVAGGLTALFAVVAVALLSSARKGAARHAAFEATRRNLELDRQLYAEVRPEQALEPSPPPEVQLEQSREEIRRVAAHSQAAETTLRFPRSRTMQVLTRGGPAGSAALLAYLMQRRHKRRRA